MKLLTNQIRRRLPKLNSTQNDSNPVLQVKFFTPWTSWTWYASEFDGENIFFGLVEGIETEWGLFSLKELKAFRGPGGIRVERDLSFEPTPANEIEKSATAKEAASLRMRLLPKDIREQLPKPGSTWGDNDPILRVRFFEPSTSRNWYVSEFDGDDRLFGLIEDGDGTLIWIFFILSELAGDGSLDLVPVERDLDFQPTPASEIIRGRKAEPYLTWPKV